MTPGPVHEALLREAIAEARRGLGRTHPNPAVGALVVKDGRIVGRGHHRRAGEPHAEVEALRDAGEAAKGADLYVTLEPHDHQGRTPPCTLAILAAGIRRVFAGSHDPNPKVSGRGFQRLRDGGVEVFSDVLGAECDALIVGFRQHILTGRPYVVLKAASSLDGRLATASGDSRWVSGEASRALVHRWRDELDAVLVGANTVLADDPLLTTRLPAPLDGRVPRTPVRVVLDGALRIAPAAKVLDAGAGPVLVVTTVADEARHEPLRAKGAEVVVLEGAGGRIDPGVLLAELGRRGLTSLLVEGGGLVHAAFVEARAADELRLFLAPKVVGGDGLGWLGALGVRTMAEARGLVLDRVERVGGDLLLTARFAPAFKE